MFIAPAVFTPKLITPSRSSSGTSIPILIFLMNFLNSIIIGTQLKPEVTGIR